VIRSTDKTRTSTAAKSSEPNGEKGMHRRKEDDLELVGTIVDEQFDRQIQGQQKA
jgi:hypothetical protein